MFCGFFVGRLGWVGRLGDTCVHEHSVVQGYIKTLDEINKNVVVENFDHRSVLK